jgi:hypothetical protein
MFIEYNWFSIRTISYLMKFHDHITNVYFSKIHYSLSMRVHKHKKLLDDICDDLNTYDFLNINKDLTYINIHNS